MELKFWKEFLSHRPIGYKFIRQKPVGNYVLDFYCSKLLLCIEIDGEIHEINSEYDNQRDEYLNACGITVVRIKNDEVLNSFERVKGKILKIINNPPPDLPPVKGDKRGLKSTNPPLNPLPA